MSAAFYVNFLLKQYVLHRDLHSFPTRRSSDLPNDTNKVVVVCHGVTENKVSSIKYLNMFVELGYNCVIYDARRHGNTGGIHSTYGFYEKYDLETVVDYLHEHYGEDIEFGIHGESMGAA